MESVNFDPPIVTETQSEQVKKTVSLQPEVYLSNTLIGWSSCTNYISVWLFCTEHLCINRSMHIPRYTNRINSTIIYYYVLSFYQTVLLMVQDIGLHLVQNSPCWPLKKAHGWIFIFIFPHNHDKKIQATAKKLTLLQIVQMKLKVDFVWHNLFIIFVVRILTHTLCHNDKITMEKR